MNAARERIRARNAEVFRRLRIDVERGVERLDLSRRIHEADRPELTFGEAATPIGDLRAQTFELVALSGFGFCKVSRRSHQESCVRRFPLRASNASATSNGFVEPVSSAWSWSSSH